MSGVSCNYMSWPSTSVFFFKQKRAYELRISDLSSDVCSSVLDRRRVEQHDGGLAGQRVEHAPRTRRAEQLRGVLRPLAGRQEVEALGRRRVGGRLEELEAFLEIGRAHV